MRILLIEPGKKPSVQEIAGTLESIQDIVGGLIQAVYPFKEPVALVCNDEGKLLGLPLNRGLEDIDGNLYDIICGTFFICGIEEDRFVSLTEEQIQHFTRKFYTPQLFLNLNGQILVLPDN